MGALHAGHLSLVDAAAQECESTVVSIFVNPTQFGPDEDFGRYPRARWPPILALMADRRVDCVFAPSTAEMYPAGATTFVEVPAAAEPLEGKFRPGHFRGVATVVLKLFNLVRPDVAYFGRKDYQQSLVVRRMAADLDLPVRVRVCPTIRESDGLALSLRNRYLSPPERKRALAICAACSWPPIWSAPARAMARASSSGCGPNSTPSSWRSTTWPWPIPKR